MRAARLDRRVRKEATQLVREAGTGPDYLPAGVAERARDQVARLGVPR